jgi:hypothetical protein
VHRPQTQHRGVVELDERIRAIKHMLIFLGEVLALVLQEEKALHPSNYLIG